MTIRDTVPSGIGTSTAPVAAASDTTPPAQPSPTSAMEWKRMAAGISAVLVLLGGMFEGGRQLGKTAPDGYSGASDADLAVDRHRADPHPHTGTVTKESFDAEKERQRESEQRVERRLERLERKIDRLLAPRHRPAP